MRHDTVITAAVLAHQGGWDEIAIVVGPLVLIVIVVLIGRRQNRADGSEPPN